MAEGKYGKYIISDPKLVTELAHHDFSEISGYTFPDEVYLDKDLLEEAGHWLDIVWIWEIPDPPDLPGSHVHPFDEIVLLVGSNPHDLRDLGAEIHWVMGVGDDAETFVIDRTTLIFVPKGLAHGPMHFVRVDRPVLNIAIGVNSGDYE